MYNVSYRQIWEPPYTFIRILKCNWTARLSDHQSLVITRYLSSVLWNVRPPEQLYCHQLTPTQFKYRQLHLEWSLQPERMLIAKNKRWPRPSLGLKKGRVRKGVTLYRVLTFYWSLCEVYYGLSCWIPETGFLDIIQRNWEICPRPHS